MEKIAYGWIVIMVLVTAVLLAYPRRAHAHDHWNDGTPVPAWVKNACCGASDQHQFDDEDVHELKEGLKVDGYPGGVIPWSKVTPSPDGKTWIFYSKYSDGSFLLRCAFHGYGGA